MLVSYFAHRFLSAVKETDRFGEPVLLNFNGESVYKTRVGGCATLLIYFFVLSFSIVKFINMINLEDPDIF